MNYNQWIDNQRDNLIRDLQGCIRIPSVYADDGSGTPYGAETVRCLDYMLSLAQNMGFPTHNMDNQLGWCEWGEGEELIAVLCHLDVVPEGEGWTVPPYEGLVRDGRIYGRGTMDDKGPGVAALYALAAVKECGLPLNRRVRLIFGLNEETGSADIQYYKLHDGEIPVMGFTPDGEYPVINGEKGIITEFYTKKLEQTGPIRLVELQGGSGHNVVPSNARARLVCPPESAKELAAISAGQVACTLTEDGLLVEAAGVSAHGSTPWQGENAIGRLMLFLDQLPLEGDLKEAVHLLADRFGMEWDGRSLGVAMADEISDMLVMNLGVAEGNEEEISIKINYRYPVTRSYGDCGPQVRAVLEEAGFKRTYQQHKSRIYMAPDSTLVTKLLKVYREYTGDQSAAPKAIGGGTYAKLMPNILAFGPIFPGDEVREHKPDEFIEIDRLLDNTKIMAAAICELAN